MMSDHELWQNALVQIELGTSEASFRTWFRGTGIARRDGGEVHIAVPSKIVKDWLREKHHKLILKALRDLDSSVRSVEYVVQRSARAQERRAQTRPNMQQSSTMALQELYIDKRDNLNPRYTFDTFVVGPFNQLAHAAAQAVVANPGLAYNPLFIYGKTGHGKTHLIQAVGNYYKKMNPSRKVFYVTSERFTIDLVSSIRSGRGNGFKDQYRQYDLLIMDDVQFIADKERTQEELFHLFNALYDNNKQIVFSSDMHPGQFHGFEERLKGRFSAGMVAEIPAPDFESRVAIITTKVEQQGIGLDSETINYIAEQIQGNIREIEGVINTIVCKAQLKGALLSKVEVEVIIKNNVRPQKGVSVEEVVKKIAHFYNVEEQSVYEKTRKKEVVKPRQIIMYMLREEFGVSYPSIGEKLGGRDHTTVIHSCDKIRTALTRDNALRQEVAQIRSLIHG